MPEGSSEKLREQRKEAVKRISQKAADLAENLLEDIQSQDKAEGGRMSDVCVADGVSVRVIHRITIERLPA